MVVTTPARAVGTVLFQNNFFNRTVDGTGAVVKPSPASGTNVACLTASGNTATGPLLSCTSNTDTQGNGKLRLTAATTSQVGGIFGSSSFPTSSGLDVTFNSYQYGGNAADGIAFGLAAVDPANPVIPTVLGPSGAALGYSSSGSVSGLTNAYLGVGLDVYGNFSGSLATGSGCASVPNINAQAPGAVVVRGPGTRTTGYCGLATTYAGTVASRLTLRATSRAASVVPVQVLINPSALPFTSDTGQSVNAGQYKVIVTPVGGTARTLSGTLPTVPSTLYPSTSWLNEAGVPKQLAFGFFGSTGSVTDYHEISNVRVLTFNPVPQLGVGTTSYNDSTPTQGEPVNYVITPSVLPGVDEANAVSVTQTVPAGVVPVGAFGTGWVCAAPSGQSITCTTSATSFVNGTVLPNVNVIATVTGSSVTSSLIQNSSVTTVSSADASPVTDTTMTAGTVPTVPSNVSVSPALGTITAGGTVTVTGSNITAATAIEIGTTAQQAAGTSVVLLPCSGGGTINCFTVSGSTLVIPSMPARATAANTVVTVVTLGVAGAASYTYVDRPSAPTTPTATAGISSATVSWVAPANNGGVITGYVVTPYLNGVAQAPVNYDATATSRTLTGLTPGGSYTFTVAATNAYGTSTASPNSAAVIPYALPAAPATPTVTAGTQAATPTWVAPANNGAAITGYVVTPYIGATGQTPQTFNSTAVSQTLTGLTAGTAYSFTVAAINIAGTGPPSPRSAVVTANAAPTLTFAAPPAGEVGVAYSQQLTVNNGTAPFTWSISSGSLPAGLTLTASTGLLSGTPTASGSFPVTVQVVDASGVIATRAVTLAIAAAPVVTFTPAAGEVTVPYSQQPTLTGGTSPITWSITAGSLPAGLTLNTATGQIAGTPTAAGSFTFTVAATDAFAVVASRTATIVIAALPTLTFTAPTAGQLGVAYSTTFDVTGGTAPLTWSIAAGSLPPGLTLNTSTGVLSGTPTSAGGYSFTVRVVDAYSKADTRAVTLNIGAGPLVIVKTANATSAVPGAVVAYTLTMTNTSAQPWTGASLTDPLTGVLDDAVYNANATASGGTVSYASSTISWTGNIPAGGTITITYSVTVNNPDVGNKVLANTVTSSTLGTNCSSGSTDTRCTATVTVSGLTIVKTASVPTTTPGGVVSYTIVVTNSGQTPYSGVTFTDNLTGVLDDAVYNNNGTATSGSVSFSSPSLTWTGNLAVGASATITYSVTVANPDNGNRTLTSTVISPTAGSSCPSGNPAASCSASVTVLIPALTISTVAGVGSTVPGGTVPYTVTMANTGQTAYTGAVVTLALADVLDDAVFNNNAAASAGSVVFNAGPGNMVWTGDLAIGAVVTVTGSVTVRNPDPGNKSLVAVASSAAAGSTCPPAGGGAACTSTVPVLIPALTLQVTADSVSAVPGTTVQYTVTVTNTGQTPYTGAAFAAALGAVLDDAGYNGDAVASSGAVSYSAPTLSWVGDLAIAATATITFSVTISQPDLGNRSLVATVTSSTPFNNCASGSADSRCVSTVAVLVPALSLSITADSASSTPGSVVTYTVSANNTGQTPYAGTVVTVDFGGVLDDAAYNNDASVSTGSLTSNPDGTWSWTLGLAAGAGATGSLSVTVNNPPGDRSLSARVISAAAGSTCPAGSSAPSCTSTVGILIPGLTITKTADVATATPGDTVQFTVLVENTGQTTLTGASFSDPLQTVLTDATYANNVTATSGTVSYAAPVLSWSGTLAPGGTATVSYSVVVLDPDPGDKRMYNSIVSTTPGSNCAPGSIDPRCSFEVIVQVPGLTITKTAGGATTTPGATVSYTIVVTNSGATAYTGAGFADPLTGVLDDATYNNNATATAGTVSYANSTVGWSGNLAVGASATVTYSVTVRAADAGNNLLTNTVTSTARGNNCLSGSADTRCTVTVPVARLVLQQAYAATTTTPGSLLTLTATFTNTGQVPYTGITVSSPSADTVDDAIPTGDQVATSSWGGPAGSLVLTSTAITWTGSIPVGGVITVTGTLTVENPDPGNKIITGTLVSNAPGNNCPSAGTDPRCTALITVLVPALTISTSADVTSTVAGGTVSYTVIINNNGQTAYTGAAAVTSLTGTLDDANYNNDAAATSGSVSFSSPNLSWSGNVAVGATVTITYSVTAKSPSAGDKTMTSSVTSSTVGNNCPPASGNTACRTTVAILTPGLTIVSSSDLSAANLLTTVTYTVTVTNTGQTNYTAAAFTSDLAGVVDDANYVEASISATTGTATYTGGTTTLSWSGELAIGASASITYQFTTKTLDLADMTMTNTVVSTSTGSNCFSGAVDSRCTTTVTVTDQSSVTVTNKADAAVTAAGNVVNYTVTVTSDLSLTTGFSIPLTDVLVNASWDGNLVASTGTATYTNSTVAWSAEMSVGETAIITFSVTVNPVITGQQVLTTVATSTASSSSHNCAAESTDPRCTSTVPIAALVIQQSYSQSTTTPGSTINLTATFTNTGAAAYEGITISSPSAGTVDDAIPNGDQTATSGSLVLSPTAIVWTGNIPIGGTVTVTGSLIVKDPDPGDKIITGTLVSTALGNNCAAGSVDIRCTATTTVLTPGLTLSKTANTTFVVPGGTADYTITITNTGQTPYTGATVTDSLAGLLDDATYNGNASATAGSVGYSAPTISWTGNLAVGATVIITYSVTALSPAVGDKTMVNPVVSSAVGSTCPPASASTACRTTVAVLTPALTITSSADVATAVPGTVVSYTVSVSNSGQTPYLPANVTVPLAGVLDDATYNANVSTTVGSVVLVGNSLVWTGSLAPVATASITYSVTVNSPDAGNHLLVQTVTSTSQGSNCAVGSGDPRCSTSIPVANLQILNTADVSTTQPTGVVAYSGVFTNTGQVPYVGISVNVSFAGALDDATYNGDAVATSGSLILIPGSGVITWTGDVPVGGTLTVTGSVTVNNPDNGDRLLRTVLTTAAAASNCGVGSVDPACTTTVGVLTPELTISKAADTVVATPGGTVNYTVFVETPAKRIIQQ